jgi:hypothetical protein
MNEFVTPDALRVFTGKKQAAAQVRFLRERFPRILFVQRDDGSIALRQEELDLYTLSKAKEARRPPTLDLSLLNKAS